MKDVLVKVDLGETHVELTRRGLERAFSIKEIKEKVSPDKDVTWEELQPWERGFYLTVTRPLATEVVCLKDEAAERLKYQESLEETLAKSRKRANNLEWSMKRYHWLYQGTIWVMGAAWAAREWLL